MKDKVSLTYKNHKLKIMLGKKELPLSSIMNPAIVVFGRDEPPTIKFEMILDHIDIDDMKIFSNFVTKNDNKIQITELDPNKIYLVEIISQTVEGFVNAKNYIRKIIKNDNVVYAHRPINQSTGLPMDSNIKVFESGEKPL